MKKTSSLFVVLFALIALAFLQLKDINPIGRAFSIPQSATSVILFGVLKIMVIFVVLAVVFFHEHKK